MLPPKSVPAPRPDTVIPASEDAGFTFILYYFDKSPSIELYIFSYLAKVTKDTLGIMLKVKVIYSDASRLYVQKQNVS